jgi:hypothetical protein
VSSAKIIGRALSFAKSGESIDLLLKQWVFVTPLHDFVHNERASTDA